MRETASKGRRQRKKASGERLKDFLLTLRLRKDKDIKRKIGKEIYKKQRQRRNQKQKQE